MHLLYFVLYSSFSPVILSIPIIALTFLVRYLGRYRQKRKFNWLGALTLAGFLLALINILWNTISFSPFTDGFHFDGNVNLIPIVSIITMVQTIFTNHPSTYSIINFFGNIGFFMPIGFFLPCLSKKLAAGWKVILFGFLLSLFIETWQLFLPSRASDVDDVILNTLGTALGLFLFWILARLFPRLLVRVRA
jgi:glycopeptide antibiotics resistance protein